MFQAFSRPVAIFFFLFIAFLSSGCGVRYTVTVDSLRDENAPSVKSFVLEPGNADTDKEDLLFKEVCGMVSPAFRARGYHLAPSRAEADAVAKISYWSEAPQPVVRTEYVPRAIPVAVRRGRRSRIDYVYVDEPTIVSYTVYTVKLCIEATTLDGERPIWRTIYGYSGTRDDFRAMLANIAPTIARGLGSQTTGVRRLRVEISNDGVITVTDPNSGS